MKQVVRDWLSQSHLDNKLDNSDSDQAFLKKQSALDNYILLLQRSSYVINT